MNLLERAAARRQVTLGSLDLANQAELGQFFTPTAVARIMADLVHLPASGTLRVLDPGAGSGMLSAAVVDRVRRERPDVQVSVTAVELDQRLWPVLADTLADCAAESGVRTSLVKSDFVQWALHTDERFDVVIQNPPYHKIRARSALDADLRSAGIAVPNIYAGFMALGTLLVDTGGQQVSITPRSWMNGTYFSHFRRTLLASFGIDAIHTFQSRSEVFDDLGVLQETIIVSAINGPQPDMIRLSSSVDHHDTPVTRHVSAAQVVTNDFVFVPASSQDAEAVKWMDCARYTLADLGMTVSTGRVVDFRSREYLAHEPSDGAVPMVYPANITRQRVVHPRDSVRKPQWVRATGPMRTKFLVPAGTYVLVKRFSAKEEKRRLVAAVWSDDGRQPAFDNKLNYIHCAGHGLDPEVAAGLAVWLNSKPVDDYFRVFSGHTQVNAGDLRQMRFPSLDQLRRLGESTHDPEEAIRRVMGMTRIEAA
ncbi:Eco57I restriction-modification methylase domain-containing protein [Actinomyces ruminicola]|uniref:site-specific DNA-methyltransferase (adenine-specific) n=1 Tax=Actinomyces ruminicola TaxID=332524 RepID=A0A1G9WBN3_9ACTO|nr:Eco57I restriction-modification methylase domain-containing protein [Actinomyces ruminicola]SDM81616.1 adenine-specific DNA-methyltransferase [Actinomyces ruminicola]